MSVYIRGLEMPTNCEKCPFLDYEEGFCLASGVKGKSGWYESALCPGSIKDSRHKDCPLITVPEHGRLGDLDELAKTFREDAADDWNKHATPLNWSDAFEDVACMIDDAPTIIPPDGKGGEV